MKNESKMKPKKIEILGVLALFLMVGGLTVPKITGTQELFDKPFEFSEDVSLQQEVDQYYYENVRFPTKYQPTIGFPSEINLNLLGKLSSGQENKYLIDAFGRVFVLPSSFLPPEKVERVVDANGDMFMRWNSVKDAEGYRIYKIKGDNTQMMDKVFGKVASSIRNLSPKGEEIVSMNASKFPKDGEDFTFPLLNPKEDEIYVVVAYSKQLGETPGVTFGYQR